MAESFRDLYTKCRMKRGWLCKDRRKLDHVRGRWKNCILTTAQVTRELRATAMEFEGGNRTVTHSTGEGGRDLGNSQRASYQVMLSVLAAKPCAARLSHISFY